MRWFTLVFLFCLNLNASQKTDASLTTSSLKEQAETAVQETPLIQKGLKKTETSASLSADASASLLKLEDPFEAPRLREFEWSFGFHLTQFQPQGKVELSDVGTQNLSTFKTTVMPSISLGTLYGFSESSAGTFEFGVEFEGGLASQTTQFTSETGSLIDGRLNSSILDSRAILRWGQNWKSPFHAKAGMGFGTYNANHVSDRTLASWSKSMGLTTYIMGLDYKLSDDWLAAINYRDFAKRSGGNDLPAPKAHLELGTQILW